MITIIQSPSTYTPAGNPIIFQINSSHANIVYFKVEILEADSNAVVSKMEIYVTPDFPTGSYVNLQKILSNVVNYEVNNSQNILSLPLTKPIFKYKVKFTERGVVNEMMADLSEPYTTPAFYVWEASFDRINFRNYVQSDYVISSGLPTKFLTTKPNKAIVNDYSAEHLYFIHDTEDNLKVVVNTYDSLSINQITYIDIDINLNSYVHPLSELPNFHIFRLQVSPKTLKESLLVDFTNVSYYTVHIEDENGDKRTETRTYFYRKLPCHLEPTNLMWVNSLGGVDSYQFVNVQEVNNITKNNYKRNIFGIDEGLYVDRTGDIWNAGEETISVGQQGSYTATTRTINDAESRWLNELFVSRKVFVELNDGSLAPVMVTNASYAIQKQKYNKSAPLHTQVSYTFSGDLIPVEATQLTTGFGNGLAQLDFIDNQMNTADAFDTVLTFISSVSMGAENGKEGVGGAVAAINNNLKFEFNKITPRVGLTQTMDIYVNGVLFMVIDFQADYNGMPCRFTDLAGITHLTTFTSGQRNF